MIPALVVAVVAVAAVALVAWPFLVRRAEEPTPEVPDEVRRLNDEIERALAAIRELEFDHRAGNLTDEDFARLDADERARAAGLVRRRDRLAAGD